MDDTFTKKPFIVSIAGGSGSGKSTLIRKLKSHPQLAPHTIHLLMDHYYQDLSGFTVDQKKNHNFDHPDALDLDLLTSHLKDLLAWKRIERPVYHFPSHSRSHTITIEPKPLILLDGILAFAQDSLESLSNLKIYIDSHADLRLLRRLKRDTKHRGRDLLQILSQYERSVRPMHARFIEPQKLSADLILSAHPTPAVLTTLQYGLLALIDP